MWPQSNDHQINNRIISPLHLLFLALFSRITNSLWDLQSLLERRLNSYHAHSFKVPISKLLLLQILNYYLCRSSSRSPDVRCPMPVFLQLSCYIAINCLLSSSQELSLCFSLIFPQYMGVSDMSVETNPEKRETATNLSSWQRDRREATRPWSMSYYKNVNGLGVRCDQIMSTLHISKICCKL